MIFKGNLPKRKVLRATLETSWIVSTNQKCLFCQILLFDWSFSIPANQIILGLFCSNSEEIDFLTKVLHRKIFK